MEADEPQDSSRRFRAGGIEANRDAITIRLPKVDSEVWNSLLDLLPGRGLLRVLSDPPEELVSHLRAARKERLLAIRSVLDALIEDTERTEAGHRPARELKIE